VHQVGLKKLK